MSRKRKIMREKCYSCGSAMEGKIENYKYLECGLKSVTLEGILVFHCAKCGAIVPEITNARELHVLIALGVLTKDSLLTGDEVRFLRKFSGYSGSELAQLAGTSKSVVSRWENRLKLGAKSDRLLRLIFFQKLVRDYLGDFEKSGETEVGKGKFRGLVTQILGSLDEMLKNIRTKKTTKVQYTIDVNKHPELLPQSVHNGSEPIPLQ